MGINAERTGKTLTLTADAETRDDLNEIYLHGAGYLAAEALVAECLHGQWEFVSPEEVGALTDAPILCDEVVYEDNGDKTITGVIAWFPQYETADPWSRLADTGMVCFTIAEDDCSGDSVKMVI